MRSAGEDVRAAVASYADALARARVAQVGFDAVVAVRVRVTLAQALMQWGWRERALEVLRTAIEVARADGVWWRDFMVCAANLGDRETVEGLAGANSQDPDVDEEMWRFGLWLDAQSRPVRPSTTRSRSTPSRRPSRRTGAR